MDIIDLLKTPSLSREEDKTGDIIQAYLNSKGVETSRVNNNIIGRNKFFDGSKKTILLNSHHDTVKVNSGWKEDPFGAKVDGDVLYGLGSNDAGASLVSLIGAFIHYYDQELPYNLVLAATAEEEIFGPKGLGSVLDTVLPEIHLGIIGEPTSLDMAVAEKGLLVIDGKTKGVAGHAARNTGVNAIYKCLRDIEWLKDFTFPKVSPHLGPVSMQVTQINAGYQHNVIPDECSFVIDIRVNDCYTNQEVVDTLRSNLMAEISPRSMRWQSRSIDINHPLVVKAQSQGINTFGSPTLSDQVHCTFPTVKIGPGDSNRSHTPDEYIKLSEIKAGVNTYVKLLENLSF